MANTIRLTTQAKRIEQDVIAKLEEALRQAHNGEIISVAIAMTKPDGAISTAFSRTNDIGRILGAVTHLQYRLCSEAE